MPPLCPVTRRKALPCLAFCPDRPPRTAGRPDPDHLARGAKKPRTAGLCGREAGACDHLPLSCLKIQRLHWSPSGGPAPLEASPTPAQHGPDLPPGAGAPPRPRKGHTGPTRGRQGGRALQGPSIHDWEMGMSPTSSSSTPGNGPGGGVSSRPSSRSRNRVSRAEGLRSCFRPAWKAAAQMSLME